jgi:CHASE3 domain sensor protein
MDRKTYKLSDDVIIQIRELLQLALLTNTNIVDHLRALIVEAETAENRGHYVTISPEYVEAYNKQIEQLNREAEEAMAKMPTTQADSSSDPAASN